jgi:hypothetical protein
MKIISAETKYPLKAIKILFHIVRLKCGKEIDGQT